MGKDETQKRMELIKKRMEKAGCNMSFIRLGPCGTPCIREDGVCMDHWRKCWIKGCSLGKPTAEEKKVSLGPCGMLCLINGECDNIWGQNKNGTHIDCWETCKHGGGE